MYFLNKFMNTNRDYIQSYIAFLHILTDTNTHERKNNKNVYLYIYMYIKLLGYIFPLMKISLPPIRNPLCSITENHFFEQFKNFYF